VTGVGARGRPVAAGRFRSAMRAGADRGSVTVELVLLAPVLLAVLGLIVGLGRIADAGGLVTGAARDGARAASLARTPAAAAAAARTAAAGDLTDAGLACPGLDVAADTAVDSGQRLRHCPPLVRPRPDLDPASVTLPLPAA